jgi:hypothetical protein
MSVVRDIEWRVLLWHVAVAADSSVATATVAPETLAEEIDTGRPERTQYAPSRYRPFVMYH